ncbi:hypothetical protein PP301_gp014 [Gordonia phage GMA2]|uniref:ADP ribosyltransferase domain-containing protein n=1 Tax=Gordonia phage GMA2 TaxID=1647283 RepID=A0A0K0N738_9CAUD|nr:hypothetical protein PP301_gp014 [Gordonia phage GMA2]AKJ72552.1 hypothetical protein GMA2_14 [Gordonia phage GMA2]
MKFTASGFFNNIMRMNTAGDASAKETRAAHEAAVEKFKDVRAYLDSNQDVKDGVLSYVKGSSVNRGLRKKHANPGKHVNMYADGEAQLAALDKLFSHDSAKLPEDMVLYRSIVLPENLKEGSTYVEPGFSSTTIDEGVADIFGVYQKILAHGEDGDKSAATKKMVSSIASVEIRAPKGTRAAYISNLAQPEDRKSTHLGFKDDPLKFDYQREMLLDRGLTYRVVSNKKNHVILEVVKDGIDDE